MAVESLLITLLGQHLLPALLGSIPIAGVMYVAFRIGLRRPAQRVVVLFLAPAKVLLLLWQGDELSCLHVTGGRLGRFSLTFPSILPSSLDNVFPGHPGAHRASGLADQVLLTLLVLAGVVLCYRWFRLAPLFRALQGGAASANAQFPGLCRRFDQLSERTFGSLLRVLRPRLLVVRGSDCPAFVMGVRPPVVVLSAEIAEQMGARELLGVLAHELAHAKRFDYLLRWLATILRDILFWNPFAWLWYRQLIVEQEHASDELAAEFLHDPAAVASGLVEISAFAGRAALVGLGPLAAAPHGSGLRSLEARVGHLEEISSGQTEGWPLPVFCPVSLLFACAQPHIILPLAQWALLLVHAA